MQKAVMYAWAIAANSQYASLSTTGIEALSCYTTNGGVMYGI